MNLSSIFSRYLFLIIAFILIVIFVIIGYYYSESPYLTLVSVLIGSFLAITTTVLSNHYFNKKEREKSIENLLHTLKEELCDDIKILNFNVGLLDNELSNQAIDINLLSRLQGYKTDFWNFVRINYPNLLDPTLFKDLSDSNFKMERINEYILIKENYKIINYAHFKRDIVQDYNKYLIDSHCELVELLQKLLKLSENSFEYSEYTTFHELLTETQKICEKYQK